MYSFLCRRELSYNNRSDYPPTYPLIYYTRVGVGVVVYSVEVFNFIGLSRFS
jgi:hypothetical protein